MINGTANAITGNRDITRTVEGRPEVLHRFTAGYTSLHGLRKAHENNPSLRVKTWDFSRFKRDPVMAMCSNTLLLLAVELSRAGSHHSNTGQRNKTLRIEGINATLALALCLRLT
ncbi:MAG: hypothetical protein Q8O70_11725 [Burkholderiales bacterium]|nr:hypothetical protein [Burkholderiales bacterium]